MTEPAKAEAKRRKLRRASGPEYICDRCWRRAETITVLPGLHAPRVARVTCWEHQPEGDLLGGAYGFKLAEWFSYGVPDWNEPSRDYSVRQHLLDTKRLRRQPHGGQRTLRVVRASELELAPEPQSELPTNGEVAVRLVERALARALVERGGR
jgi:hypothetical protein